MQNQCTHHCIEEGEMCLYLSVSLHTHSSCILHFNLYSLQNCCQWSNFCANEQLQRKPVHRDVQNTWEEAFISSISGLSSPPSNGLTDQHSQRTNPKVVSDGHSNYAHLWNDRLLLGTLREGLKNTQLKKSFKMAV